MKMNLKKKWRAASLALLLGVGVFASGSAFAQAEEKQYPYYEGSSWNQFHGRMDYLKGTPDKICAAAVQAWSKTTEVTHLDPNYTHIWEGTYKGNPRISPSLTYILCDADLKQSLIYPTQPESNRVIVSENAGASVLIEKFEEFAPNDNMCRGRARGDLGGVACDGDKKAVCFWPDLLVNPFNPADPGNATDLQARQIIYDCVKEHEEVHYNDKTGFCHNGRRSYWGHNGDWDQAEIDGYTTVVNCILRERNRCDKSNDRDACRSQIFYFMNVSNDKKIEHDNGLAAIQSRPKP